MQESRASIFSDLSKINASVNGGNFPEEIMLMPYGEFNTIKGKFTFNKDRADRAVANFDKGVGRVHLTAPLPVNFNHRQSDKAAAWMHALIAKDDGLYSRVTWSRSGKEALEGEEYRFLSIEYNFTNYTEPDDTTVKFNDVVEGAGLTNIPLMRKMKPLMASTSGLTENDSTHIVYLEDRSDKVPVTLDEARAMKPSEVTEEAKGVLTASKDKLSFAERTAFGLDEPTKTPEQIAADKKKADDEATETARLAAEAAKVGMVSKAEFEASNAKVAKLEAEGRKRDAEIEVEKHAARGAIKAEAKEGWVELLADADDSTRETLTKQLQELPTNELLAADTKHKGANSSASVSEVQEELKTETLKVQAEAEKAGRKITYAQAQDELLRANKELEGKINAERASR